MGIGNENDTFELIEIQFEDMQIEVKKICSGDNHTIILTKNGLIYGSGSNEFGQLGSINEEEKSKSTFLFKQITIKEAVEDIGCGIEFTLLLLKDTNKIKILGRFQCSDEIVENYCFSKISASAQSITLLTLDQQKIFHLQRKRNNLVQEFVVSPPSSSSISKLVSTFSNIFILFNDGSVFGSLVPGKKNKFGLGFGCNSNDNENNSKQHNLSATLMFYPINYNSYQKCKVVDIVGGWNHLILAAKSCTKYHLFGLGRNDFGQFISDLTQGCGQKNVKYSDRPIEFYSSRQKLTCWCGSENTIFVENDSIICGIGWNEHGNCFKNPSNYPIIDTLFNRITVCDFSSSTMNNKNPKNIQIGGGFSSTFLILNYQIVE